MAIEKNGNGITIQKLWTIVLIVNVVGGAFVGYYFLKHIQPYSDKINCNAQTLILNQAKIDQLEKTQDEHKEEITKRPTGRELKPVLESIEKQFVDQQKQLEEHERVCSELNKSVNSLEKAIIKLEAKL